jgi:hypothetical protein
MIFASAALMACSDDDVVSDPDDGSLTENDAYNSYVTVALSIPETSDTRAGALEGDPSVTATDDERKVNRVYVYAFKDPSTTASATPDSSWVLAESVTVSTIDNATDKVPVATDQANSVYCYGTAVFKRLTKSVEGETYHIYVTVNAPALDATGQPWDTTTTTVGRFLRESRFDINTVSHVNTTNDDPNKGKRYYKSDDIVQSYAMTETYTTTKNDANSTESDLKPTALPKSFDGGFVMASRMFNDLNTGAGNVNTDYAVLKIYNSNSESNPAVATVAVERVMARLNVGLTKDYDKDYLTPVLTSSEAATDSNSNVYAIVTLDKYYPINIAKQSYLFRHKATGSAEAFDGNGNIAYSYDNLSDLNEATAWSGGTWTSAEYVVDPFTATDFKKTTYDKNDNRATSYSYMFYNPLHAVQVNKTTTTGSGESASSTTSQIDKIKVFATLEKTTDKDGVPLIGYCLENTTLAKYQQKDLSTGIIFSASFVPTPNHVYTLYNTSTTEQELISIEELKKLETEVLDNYNADATYASDTTTTGTAYRAAAETLKTDKQAHKTAIDAYNSKLAAYNTALALWEENKPNDFEYKKDYIDKMGGEAKAALEAYSADSTALQTAIADTVTTHNKLYGPTSSGSTVKGSIELYNEALTAYEEALRKSNIYDQKDAIVAALKDYAQNTKGLYFYNYNFYTSIEALAKVMTLPNNLMKKSDNSGLYDDTARETSTGKSNKQILYEYGVTWYDIWEPAKLSTAPSDGKSCSITKDATYRTYYLYTIKHYKYATSSSDPDVAILSPMKFAVVRNNIYQMQISGVSALGAGSVDPTDPDPTDTFYPGPNPDEDKEIYLKMELQILNWVLRDEGTITLK